MVIDIIEIGGLPLLKMLVFQFANCKRLPEGTPIYACTSISTSISTSIYIYIYKYIYITSIIHYLSITNRYKDGLVSIF